MRGAKENDEFKDWTREELEEYARAANELFWWLHRHDSQIGLTEQHREDLHDMVYSRIEP